MPWREKGYSMKRYRYIFLLAILLLPAAAFYFPEVAEAAIPISFFAMAVLVYRRDRFKLASIPVIPFLIWLDPLTTAATLILFGTIVFYARERIRVALSRPKLKLEKLTLDSFGIEEETKSLRIKIQEQIASQDKYFRVDGDLITGLFGLLQHAEEGLFQKTLDSIATGMMMITSIPVCVVLGRSPGIYTNERTLLDKLEGGKVSDSPGEYVVLCTVNIDGEGPDRNIDYEVGRPQKEYQRVHAFIEENREPVIINDVRKDGRFPTTFSGRKTSFFLALPLLGGGGDRTRVEGLVELESTVPRVLDKITEQRVAHFVWAASMALQTARLFEYNENLSTTDSLTGLFNHSYFQEKLRDELSRVRQFGRPLGLILLDIDHFKKLNDRYGHIIGDAVLSGLGRILRTHLRQDIDCVARYGGEEFAVILPDTDSEGTRYAAEKLRREVSDLLVAAEAESVQITASFGIVTAPSAKSTAEDLIALADKALYVAKNEGRNCVREAKI